MAATKISKIITEKPANRPKVSDKTKTEVTRVKKLAEPKNVAKKMLGKIDKQKVESVAGEKESNKSYKPIGDKKQNITATPVAQEQEQTKSTNTDASKALRDIFSLMIIGRAYDLKNRAIEKSTEEERRNEDQKRHDEFIKTLKIFTGVNVIGGKPEGKDTGLLGMLKGMIDSAISGIHSLLKPITSFLSMVGSPLMALGKYMLSNPLLLGALTWAIGVYQANKFLTETDYGKRMSKGEGKLAEKAFKEKQTDFTKLKITQDEAKAILEQPDSPAKKRDIASFGGIERLTAISQGLPDPGGKPLSTTPDMNTPTNQTDKFKQLEGKSESTGVKMELPPEVVPSTAGAGRGVMPASSYERIDEKTNNITNNISAYENVSNTNNNNVYEKTTSNTNNNTMLAQPLPSIPEIAKPIEQNIRLQQDVEHGSGQSVAQPIITNNVSGSTVDEAPISTQPSIRDMIPILDKVFRGVKGAW
jgi:hypothetical protein